MNNQPIIYSGVPSVAKPVFIHVPKAENSLGVIENKRLNSEVNGLEPIRLKKNLILFYLAQLNDLIRDLNLSKDKAELLGSRLKEKNLLNENVRIFYRNRKEDLIKFFSDEDSLIYCNDVNKLIKAVGHKHIASEWRLFIGSNKISLKEVLLHNGNEFPSISVAYASHLKECYEVMKMLLLKINYHAHCSSICLDFEVIAILLGLQTGYTKYCCFLCYWDSRARDKHYTVKVWSERDSFKLGQRNIAEDPLVDTKNVNQKHVNLNISNSG